MVDGKTHAYPGTNISPPNLGHTAYVDAYYLHSGKSNILFHDGHVEDIKKEDGIDAYSDSNRETSKFRWCDSKDINYYKRQFQNSSNLSKRPRFALTKGAFSAVTL